MRFWASLGSEGERAQGFCAACVLISKPELAVQPNLQLECAVLWVLDRCSSPVTGCWLHAGPRSMEWAYNSRMECWISQVGMSGTFKLTREEKLNDTTVGGLPSARAHTHAFAMSVYRKHTKLVGDSPAPDARSDAARSWLGGTQHTSWWPAACTTHMMCCPALGWQLTRQAAPATHPGGPTLCRSPPAPLSRR